MRFKLLGLLLLLAGMFLVGYALVLDRSIPDPALKPQTYCLAAIFLAITVRVLQAERHHRAAHRRQAAEEEPLHSAELPPEPKYFEAANH